MSDMIRFEDMDKDGRLGLNEFYAAFSKLYSEYTATAPDPRDGIAVVNAPRPAKDVVHARHVIARHDIARPRANDRRAYDGGFERALGRNSVRLCPNPPYARYSNVERTRRRPL